MISFTRGIGTFLLSLCVFLSVSIHAESDQYQVIEWVQLMPEDDLNALLNPPESLLGIEDGSAMDSVDALSSMTDKDEQTQRFYEALKSARVVETFADQAIRLPGFIVPLASDDENRVTEFFIVPYFGACLHMPPPPPNQIVYAKLDEGFELKSLYDPFWFEGQLKIENTDHSLGASAYSLALDNLYPYED